ncbi:MAG: acyltransferase [Pseudomonadota bacterium]
MTIHSPTPDLPAPKLVEIQLLRAVAAGTVAFLHLMWSFADELGGGFGFSFDGSRASQGAVMLFFVISGYVMVTSSTKLFGRSDARSFFWARRLTRIMPPYWIGTVALVIVFATIAPQPVNMWHVCQSLLLVPNLTYSDDFRSYPFLWPGWTLFYELLFYGVLGAFMTHGRRMAIIGACLALSGLVIAGLFIVKEAAVDSPFMWTITRPILLVFIPGMGLALLRERGWSAPLALRAAALVAAVVMIIFVPKPAFPYAMGFDYVVWCGLPALLLAFSIIAGPTPLPAPGLISKLGDMSYALYLLHVPVAWAWYGLYPQLVPFEPGPWDFLITVSALSCVISWFFYDRVERPMTAALNRRLTGRKIGVVDHQKRLTA